VWQPLTLGHSIKVGLTAMTMSRITVTLGVIFSSQFGFCIFILSQSSPNFCIYLAILSLSKLKPNLIFI